MDLTVVDAGEVKGVHGLAILEHDIVCDVDNVVYGTHTGITDTLAHPCGAGSDADVLDHTGGVAGAELRVFNDYLCIVVYIAVGAGLHNRLVELELLAEGDGSLTGKTDHAEAVGAVGSDLKFHNVIIIADYSADIVAGLAILTEDKNTVGNAVGELLLLCVQILKSAHLAELCVVSEHIAVVDILAVGDDLDLTGAQIKLQLPLELAVALNMQHVGCNYGAVYTVTVVNVGADGGLFGVDGMVVTQNGGGLYLTVGIVMGGQRKLFEGAEHTGGLNTAQLALFNLHAAGQQGLVQSHGYKVAHMDVPCTGADLYRLFLSHIQLCHQHMVGIGVLVQREDLAHHNAVHALAEILGDFHLGARDGHSLGKTSVVIVFYGKLNKLIEPFS